MAYFTKEIYERKLEWRQRHNASQLENCKELSEEAHNSIAEFHSARHNFHSSSSTHNVESCDFTLIDNLEESYNNLKKLVEIDSLVEFPEFLPSDDDIEDYIEPDEDEDDYDIRQLALERMRDDHNEQKEKINSQCRELIKNINEKYSVEY